MWATAHNSQILLKETKSDLKYRKCAPESIKNTELYLLSKEIEGINVIKAKTVNTERKKV